MHAVDRRQEEVVLEELATGERLPYVDQSDPLDDLEDQECHPESGGQERLSPGTLEPPAPGELDTSGHGPRAREQDDRLEHAQPQQQMRLPEKKCLLVLGP